MGSSRFDVVGGVLAAGQAAPDHAPRSGPAHGAICFLRELVGLDVAPVGEPVLHVTTLHQWSCFGFLWLHDAAPKCV
jgi:hypothetical protein